MRAYLLHTTLSCLLLVSAAAGTAMAVEHPYRVSLQSGAFAGRDLNDGVRSLCGMQSLRQLAGERHLLRLGYAFTDNLTVAAIAGAARTDVIDRTHASRAFHPLYGGALTLTLPLDETWSAEFEAWHQRSEPPDYSAPSGIRGINDFSFDLEESSAALRFSRRAASGLTVFAGGCYTYSVVHIRMYNSACGGCLMIDRRLKSTRRWRGLAGLAWPLTDGLDARCEFMPGGESSVTFRLDYRL